MAKYKIDPPRVQRTYKLVPQGMVEGFISRIVNEGIVESTYQGQKRTNTRLTVHIETNLTYTHEEDGESYHPNLFYRVNLTSSRKGKLCLLREAVNGGTTLTDEQLVDFDDEEIMYIPIGIIVKHNQGVNRDGKPQTYANVDSIWRLEPDKIPEGLEAQIEEARKREAEFAAKEPELPDVDKGLLLEVELTEKAVQKHHTISDEDMKAVRVKHTTAEDLAFVGEEILEEYLTKLKAQLPEEEKAATAPLPF